MSSMDRQYVYIAARLRDNDDRVSPTAVARALNRAPEHLSRNRDRLINQHHVLQPVERGVMQFNVPGFADWVVARVDHRNPAKPARLAPGHSTQRAIEPFRDR